MKKIIGVFLILYSLIMTVACPVTASDIAKVKAASGKMATYSNSGVNLTRELYNANFLSLNQKDVIARKFITLGTAGIAFDTAVKAIETQYGSNTPPKSEIERLTGVFDTKVVEAFLDILTSLKVIIAKGNYATIIDLIRTAVLVVAGVLHIRSQVNTKIVAAT